MKIDDISHKALQRLHLLKKAPTPAAYFEAFYEIAQREGVAQIEELNWHTQWLHKFDISAQNQLKNARNPNEFIDILARLLKESKQECSIEHTQQLKGLIRRLLGVIADVFSIGAKNKYHFLFRLNHLNNLEETKKLITYWDNFRASKVHLSVLKKLSSIIAHMLRIPDNKGAVSKEALEISSMLMMHSENLIDAHLLARVEQLLGIKSEGDLIMPLMRDEDLKQSCIAIFGVNDLRAQTDGHIDTHKATNKAMEILRKICLNALGEGTLVGNYKNGFAFMFKDTSTQHLLDKMQPIAAQLQAQKFSYQGVLFTFGFAIKVIEGKDFSSIAALQAQVLHTLQHI